MIPNHVTAALSDLDLQVVASVPPGGNWKNIPPSIPSRRLEQIRLSFKQGLGSRSTYYGRLQPDKPSYTISTYFSRPGNGCHIHYSQNRVLSQREAARLQSFPDDFVFRGTKAAINTQIGNAVPPLLAFQVANQIGHPGAFVDLFCGAGGLGLGFKWAGWRPAFGTDVNPSFLSTYAENVHDQVILGSITDDSLFDTLVATALTAKRQAHAAGRQFWVLGGPPCQGFSTAGNRRTMDDARNLLFWNYQRFVGELQPDGFVFENVTGLMNMEGGRTFGIVKEAFAEVMPSVQFWVLRAEEHAVPQRRRRLFILGRQTTETIAAPERVASCEPTRGLFEECRAAVSVAEAISDLPPLSPGEDGTPLDYVSDAASSYQELMRCAIDPATFLARFRAGSR